MTIEKLLENIKKVDIRGIISVDIQVARKDGDSCIIVSFLRLKGFLKNDQNHKFIMVIDPKGPNEDMYFLVPSMESCGANDLSLTIYMDANMRTFYGAHRWQVGNNGDVIFSYSLPMPSNIDDFPDISVLQRILKGMYFSVLFREVKSYESHILNDDMMGQEEKEEKMKKLQDAYSTLAGSKEIETI